LRSGIIRLFRSFRGDGVVETLSLAADQTSQFVGVRAIAAVYEPLIGLNLGEHGRPRRSAALGSVVDRSNNRSTDTSITTGNLYQSRAQHARNPVDRELRHYSVSSCARIGRPVCANSFKVTSRLPLGREARVR
jgi:hypothetical protein